MAPPQAQQVAVMRRCLRRSKQLRCVSQCSSDTGSNTARLYAQLLFVSFVGAWQGCVQG